MKVTPLIIAHRGASAEAPENTLVSIQKAIDLGVDFIEVDVHLSRDGIPVLIHDATIKRTTNVHKKIKVSDLTLEELHQLDAGSWFGPNFVGEKIPTLESVLLLKRPSSTGLMLELKEGGKNPIEIVNAVTDSIKKNMKPGDPLLVGSFSLPIIQQLINQKYPLKVAGIIEKLSFLPLFQQLDIKHLVLWHKLIHPRLLDTLHNSGMQVWVFTVDAFHKAQTLASLGIDGIITNHPNKMMVLRQS